MKQRNGLRFPPPGEPVIRLHSLSPEEPKVKTTGLIRDESRHGCCAVFRKPFVFKINEIIAIDFELVKDVEGTIKWMSDLDDDFVKVGIFIP